MVGQLDDVRQEFRPAKVLPRGIEAGCEVRLVLRLLNAHRIVGREQSVVAEGGEPAVQAAGQVLLVGPLLSLSRLRGGNLRGDGRDRMDHLPGRLAWCSGLRWRRPPILRAQSAEEIVHLLGVAATGG